MLFKPFLFGLFLLQLARSFGRLSLFGGKKSRNKNCKTDEFEKYNVPANSSAKCIDGSSPSFYFRQGKDNGVSKWFVYFEGGGWCYDMKACEIRSKIHYGSSLEYPRCEKVDKANIFLTSDQKKNPQFYNWNMVHVKYCDGSSYAGDRDVVHNGKTFFFRGKHNREQTILSLLSLGMKSAKEIVISGCSAGGLAIYLGLDQMVHQIKEVNPSASVRGVSFSGFFLDYSSTKPQVEGNKDDGVWNGYLDYANSMKNLYQWMNIRSGANPRCVSSQLQRHRNDTDCIFAYYLAAHIKTPIFNIQVRRTEFGLFETYFVYRFSRNTITGKLCTFLVVKTTWRSIRTVTPCKSK